MKHAQFICWSCGFNEPIEEGACSNCGAAEHNPATVKVVRQALAKRIQEEIDKDEGDKVYANGLRRALNIVQRARK